MDILKILGRTALRVVSGFIRIIGYVARGVLDLTNTLDDYLYIPFSKLCVPDVELKQTEEKPEENTT